MPHGIDVSEYQLTISWDKVRASGRADFAIIRAGGGDNVFDKQWYRNWQEAHRVGVPAGAYWFHRPEDDAERQADLFYSRVGALSAGDLIPWIDVEWYSYRRTNLAEAVQGVAMLVWHCEQRFGKPVGIYTAAWAWNPLPITNSARWQGIPLWVASYNTVGKPVLPKTWGSWVIQQYTSIGEVNGIAGNVDRNYCPDLTPIMKPKPVSTVKQDVEDALAEMDVAIRKLQAAVARL